MHVINQYNFKILKTIARESEVDKCKLLAITAIKNANARGAKSNFNDNEPKEKMMGYLTEYMFDVAMQMEGIPGKWLMDCSGKSDDGVDWKHSTGYKIDVKSMSVKTAPPGYYSCLVLKSSADKHPPDMYVFVKYNHETRECYITGGMPAEELFKKARIQEKGEWDGKFKASKDCYTIKQNQTWDYARVCEFLKTLK